jgi:N-acetylmuramoyl-L-alanine amidase
VGPSGLSEKAVVLSVAEKMKETLSESYEVHLTRDGDFAVDLEARTGAANHYRADVFVSLHAGGAFGHQGRGTVVFYYGRGKGASPFTSEQGNAVAVGENPTPWDDLQNKHQARAKILATLVHHHLREQISPADMGVREAPCLVLCGADMPAVLVEIAHMSHPAEAALLKKPETISAVAQAISAAIRAYFTDNP